MRRRRFIVIVALMAAAFAVVAWRSARAKHRAEIERHALVERRTVLAVRLQRGEVELAAAKLRTAEPVAAVVEPPGQPVAVAESSPAGARAANSLVEWLEDPKVQVLHFAQQRANLAQSYGPFFWKEGLTPTQIERLCDLIIQSRASALDLSEINRLQGRSFDDPEMRVQHERDKAEIEAGMREVLGEAGHTRLKDYLRSLDIRTYVGKIAGAAALEDVPINREQADALVNALAAATPLYSMGGKAEFGRIDWQTAETQAQGILSAAQMKLLREDRSGFGPSRRSSAVGDAIHRAIREIDATGKPVGK